jgi:IS605 OrfB family transposase
MCHNTLMVVQRCATILLPEDADLRATLDAFQQTQQALSPVCFNQGQPLGAPAFQKRVYHSVKGALSAQMTCSAIRAVAAAYQSAHSNHRPAQQPFRFHRKRAFFLIGRRGRDAQFRADGTLSLWTVNGRKRLSYQVPEHFRATLESAVEIDSLTVIERNGQLLGRVTVTLELPEPQGTRPVGIDLNETNALVAVNPEGETLFVSGREVNVRNQRAFKTRKRFQKKLAARKAQKRDTRSVRRLLKRLGRKRSNRTRTFAQTAAKRVADWAGPDAVLVFEELHVPQPQKGIVRGKKLRRRLSEWQRGLIVQYARSRAQERGQEIALVDPAYTSQCCSVCGRLGRRRRHSFTCSCGHAEHADINAARNIRDRYTVSQGAVGTLSTCPEALGQPEGKLPAKAGSR